MPVLCFCLEPTLEHVWAAPVGDRAEPWLALAWVNLVSFVVATTDSRQSMQNVRLTITTERRRVKERWLGQK